MTFELSISSGTEKAESIDFTWKVKEKNPYNKSYIIKFRCCLGDWGGRNSHKRTLPKNSLKCRSINRSRFGILSTLSPFLTFHLSLPSPVVCLLLVSKPLGFPSEPLSFSILAFPPQNSEFSCISLWHLPITPSISNFVHLILICVPRHDSQEPWAKKTLFQYPRLPKSVLHYGGPYFCFLIPYSKR